MIKDKTIWEPNNKKFHAEVFEFINKSLFRDVDGVVDMFQWGDDWEQVTVKIDGAIGFVYRIELDIRKEDGEFYTDFLSIEKEYV